MPDLIQQGESYAFSFSLTGDGVSSFSGTYKVVQYPGDTPTITGNLTLEDGEFTGLIPGTSTANLDPGQWFVYGETADSDEDVKEPIKFYVAKGW